MPRRGPAAYAADLGVGRRLSGDHGPAADLTGGDGQGGVEAVVRPVPRIAAAPTSWWGRSARTRVVTPPPPRRITSTAPARAGSSAQPVTPVSLPRSSRRPPSRRRRCAGTGRRGSRCAVDGDGRAARRIDLPWRDARHDPAHDLSNARDLPVALAVPEGGALGLAMVAAAGGARAPRTPSTTGCHATRAARATAARLLQSM